MERSITIVNPTVGKPVPTPPVPPPLVGEDWQVPYFSQINGPWVNDRINNNGAAGCKSTIGKIGCALTSLAMLYQHYGVNYNPRTLNACLGGAACPLNWGHGLVSSCSAGRVRFISRPGFSYPALEQHLRNGPVILELRRSDGYMHFVVVLGGRGSDPRNYRVNDPGVRQGANQTLAVTMASFRGYSPAGMRIYTGIRPTALPTIEEATELPSLQAPQPQQTVPITGAIALYRNTQTEMVLELAAQSSAGTVAEMRVWTEHHPSPIWQPFAQYVSVPLDDAYYVQYRDTAGNTSAVISASIPEAPEAIDDNTLKVYLPLLRR